MNRRIGFVLAFVAIMIPFVVVAVPTVLVVAPVAWLVTGSAERVLLNPVLGSIVEFPWKVLGKDLF